MRRPRCSLLRPWRSAIWARRRPYRRAHGRPRDIWFHLSAELVTAGLLVAAGIALLRRAPAGRQLAAVGSGALLYTALNSAGYYADLGEWAVVGMFLGLAAGTAAAVARRLLRPPAAPARRDVPAPPRLGARV
jgi:hypothetical protein